MNKVHKSFQDWQQYHYEVEKDYARRIISSAKYSNERKQLFEDAYNTVIGEIIRKYNPGEESGGGNKYPEVRVSIVRNLVQKGGYILEIGCSGADLIIHLIENGYRVKGIDVAKDNVRRANEKLSKVTPENIVEHIDFIDYQTHETFDCIIMDNVIEHIVPDTIHDVLKKCYDLLKRKGYLILITPHRFSGPHDISRSFLPIGAKPEGFHLIEFSFTDLAKACSKAGFQQVLTFPFHPRLLRKLNIFPKPTLWATRKSQFLEKIVEKNPLSQIMTLNKTLSMAIVAVLFPALCVGVKKI